MEVQKIISCNILFCIITLLPITHFRKFIGSFIDFPKPLIAVINGPAIGVSVTALGLFDIVYATDRVSYLSDKLGHLSDEPI